MSFFHKNHHQRKLIIEKYLFDNKVLQHDNGTMNVIQSSSQEEIDKKLKKSLFNYNDQKYGSVGKNNSVKVHADANIDMDMDAMNRIKNGLKDLKSECGYIAISDFDQLIESCLLC